MRLLSGNFLGPCEIVAPLGAGDMGEVYPEEVETTLRAIRALAAA